MKDKEPDKTSAPPSTEGECERKIYRIKRNDFEFWCDYRVEAKINQFRDDDVFIIEDGGIQFNGKHFKSRNFRRMVFDSLRRVKAKEDHERRCYPSARDVQVFLIQDQPRVYITCARFEPARLLAEELDMPVNDKVRYVICLLEGALLIRGGKSPERLKQYSLEIFGLAVERPPSSDPWLEMVPMPDPSQYVSEPTYCWWDGVRLVQAWRRRVFPCAVELLGASLAEPLSPKEPQTLYLEECWHPNRGRRVLLGGASETMSQVTKRNRFQSDAFGILQYQNVRGRSVGSKLYPTEAEFKLAARKAYYDLVELIDGRPTRVQVATQMGISSAAFSYYMRDFDLKWPQDLRD